MKNLHRTLISQKITIASRQVHRLKQEWFAQMEQLRRIRKENVNSIVKTAIEGPNQHTCDRLHRSRENARHASKIWNVVAIAYKPFANPMDCVDQFLRPLQDWADYNDKCSVLNYLEKIDPAHATIFKKIVYIIGATNGASLQEFLSQAFKVDKKITANPLQVITFCNEVITRFNQRTELPQTVAAPQMPVSV